MLKNSRDISHSRETSNSRDSRDCRISEIAEPVFLNVYGTRESIPRNKFRQPM
jgi:hypothetical protein